MRHGSELDRAFKISAARAVFERQRQPADAAYLDALAKRLAAAACLPLDLAEKRVKAMAISNTPGWGTAGKAPAGGLGARFEGWEVGVARRPGKRASRLPNVPGLPLGVPGPEPEGAFGLALGCYNFKRTIEGRAQVGKYFSARESGVSGDAFSTAPLQRLKNNSKAFASCCHAACRLRRGGSGRYLSAPRGRCA